jgi:hypothetical protein
VILLSNCVAESGAGGAERNALVRAFQHTK